MRKGQMVGGHWTTVPPTDGMEKMSVDIEQMDASGLKKTILELVNKHRDLFKFVVNEESGGNDFIIKTSIPRPIFSDLMRMGYSVQEVREIINRMDGCDHKAFVRVFGPIEEFLDGKYEDKPVDKNLIARLRQDLNEYNLRCSRSSALTYVDALLLEVNKQTWEPLLPQ